MNNFFNTNIVNVNKNNGKNNMNNMRMISMINNFLSSSKNLSDDYLNNTDRSIEYLGEGINGDIYKLKKKNSSEYYVIKIIKFNAKIYDNIKKELSLLKKIESNELCRHVINPCLDHILSKDHLITVFDSFNGITLLEFINQCHNNDIDNVTRCILLKYILKQCFQAIYLIHSLDLCHLQINPHSILVKINVDKLTDTNNI
jgi:serine/threonine protein kinase